ncbi:hypothetical protein [Alkalinema sp. FACHB-956]|uniref:hypothetical protein n=1 Tax=Alkalinema sp. FACHB-956 TaxID=2692768 RepID=UPI0016820303|nr:hypothetical protein [Alkalinema sp. FACHB-956]MBD2327246.1 hypothetical protein [Alkalinema sp. FACHB-956]
MDRVCFLDNDIIHKLVAMSLFYEAIDVLHIERSNLQILPTARYWFSSQKKRRQQYSDVVWDMAIAVVNACRPISIIMDEDSLSELEYLNQFRNVIHEGEQQLILATRSQPDFLLLTGDKVCLAALPKLSEEIYQRLEGRVICLEQVVWLLIQQLGFEVVKTRVLPMRQYDKAIQACFGSGEQAQECNVLETLTGYITNLQRQVPGLLANIEQLGNDPTEGNI